MAHHLLCGLVILLCRYTTGTNQVVIVEYVYQAYELDFSWFKNSDIYFLQQYISEIRTTHIKHLTNFALHVWSPHVISWREQQNPDRNFAVPFLKIHTLYMLWRAQFLSDFYIVFCVHQILILLPL